MNAILVVVLIASGIASQYAPGVSERVIGVRQSQSTAYPLPQDLPSVDGYIAMRDPDLIGEIVYIVHDGELESFLVIDCAKENNSDGTMSWMDRNGIVVEVDHHTAVRWNTVGRGTMVHVFTVYSYNEYREMQ